MDIREKLLSLFGPKSQNEDQRRQEIILNTLVWFSIGAFVIINVIRAADIISNPADRGLPLGVTIAILAFFIFLLWLSRRGLIRSAAWLLIAVYAMPMAYSFLTWGADLPAALLMSVLVITMSGVLLSARLALASATLISIFLVSLTNLQSRGIWPVSDYWRQESHEIQDATAYSVLIITSAAIAFLFAREIEKALKRARLSEEALRQERDRLELRVAQKTEQLRLANAEKLSQLYRLAALGRLSSGIFHDLVNPLTAVSLSLELMNGQGGTNLNKVQAHLDQAIMATKKIEGLVASIKKQIGQSGPSDHCVVADEIRDALEILAYKARQAGVTILSEVEPNLCLPGSPIKLSQVVMNLLSNAIEASANISGKKSAQSVLIQAYRRGDCLEIKVSDSGHGIKPADLPHIFEPFFSTKRKASQANENLGLGLSSAKEIVVRHFQGQISAKNLEIGSEFLVQLPIKKDDQNKEAAPEI